MSKKTTGVIVGAEAGSKGKGAWPCWMLDEAAFLDLIGSGADTSDREPTYDQDMTRRFIAVTIGLAATVASSSA